MSTRRTYRITTTTTVLIKTMTKIEIDECIEALKQMIVEKINKVSRFLEGCKYQIINNILILQDNLGIHKETKQILDDYGFIVKEVVDETTKGKVYIITDEIIMALHLLSNIIDINVKDLLNISTAQTAEIDLPSAIESILIQFNNVRNKVFDNPLVPKILKAAYHDESIEVQHLKYIERYEDRRPERVIKTLNEDANYNAAKNDFNRYIENLQTDHKNHMIKGATTSIEVQAKKMGYTVKKVLKETEIELVLIREK